MNYQIVNQLNETQTYQLVELFTNDVVKLELMYRYQ